MEQDHQLYVFPADITVNDATLTSTASQGVVVEGQNSVTLNNVALTADNNT